MDLGLAGMRAVVSGGTKGIGRAIAETLVAEGVAFCARSANDVAAAQTELGHAGGRVFGRSLDVADPEALKRWIGGAAADLGGLDIVVANVSALAIGPDEDSWRRGFAHRPHGLRAHGRGRHAASRGEPGRGDRQYLERNGA